MFLPEKVTIGLGPEGFIDWVRENCYQLQFYEDIPESSALAPGSEKIKEEAF